MTKTQIRQRLIGYLGALAAEGATVPQIESVTRDIAANDAGWARLGPAKSKTRKGVRKAGAR